VGRAVEGGVDVDKACAARMDEWIVWEAEEEGLGVANKPLSFLFPHFFSFL
jgi:hypothetical protein